MNTTQEWEAWLESISVEVRNDLAFHVSLTRQVLQNRTWEEKFDLDITLPRALVEEKIRQAQASHWSSRQLMEWIVSRASVRARVNVEGREPVEPPHDQISSVYDIRPQPVWFDEKDSEILRQVRECLASDPTCPVNYLDTLIDQAREDEGNEEDYEDDGEEEEDETLDPPEDPAEDETR